MDERETTMSVVLEEGLDLDQDLRDRLVQLNRKAKQEAIELLEDELGGDISVEHERMIAPLIESARDFDRAHPETRMTLEEFRDEGRKILEERYGYIA
jgi:hypothetical protein